jgi:hypothetical protein
MQEDISYIFYQNYKVSEEQQKEKCEEQYLHVLSSF